jgi:hypothetical protein
MKPRKELRISSLRGRETKKTCRRKWKGNNRRKKKKGLDKCRIGSTKKCKHNS